MANHHERRRCDRADIDVYLEEIYFCGRQLGRTMDISESGVRYLTGLTAPTRTGEEVFLELPLPDDSRPLRVLGHVVGEMNDALFRTTSVAFTSMTPEDAARVRGYITQQLAT